MKIKKSKTVTAPAQPGAGGATIADRFKLDQVTSGPAYKGPTTSKAGATCALIAGLVSLTLVGALTFIIYQHWEYLMPA